ncbi:MAG TPA: HNH endonuclease signature motif containing protein [Anaerolineae bacterium]|nr:HNH endonuclease signature motif containing protein [Anaerolineae bacterium]
MTHIPDAIRNQIVKDAGGRCGYCLTAQKISGAQMHIDHIVPLAHGGVTEEANLWLACAWCNSYKGDKTHTLDPQTGENAPLFNPRTQVWTEHFCWSDDGAEIIGLTSTGRATVVALQMNNEFIVPARRHWIMAGWHPPKA